MILSGIIETNSRRALSISNQDFSVFFTRPVCASLPRHQPLHPVQPALEGMEEVPRRQRRLIPQPL